MTITAGTRLGRYEIRAKIGEGGMGDVYPARYVLEPVVRQNQIAGPWLNLWLIAEQDNSCWLRSSSRFDLSR